MTANSSTLRTCILTVGLATVLVARTAHSQHIVGSFTVDDPTYELGASVAVLGDLTGDGYDEVAMGLPGGGWLGQPAEVRIGGGAYATLVSTTTGDRFGHCIARLGDLDGDGVPDFAVGAPKRTTAAGMEAGVVALFSGASRAPLFEISGAYSYDQFGYSVDGGVDINGDALPDLLIGAPRIQWDGGGSAVIASGADGSILRTHSGLPDGADFGTCVRWLVDIDGDGVEEYAVGAPTMSTGQPLALNGLVRVYSGATGTQLAQFVGSVDQARFGTTIALLGDVNRDGVSDFAVGAPSVPSSSASSITVFSGRTLGVLLTKHIAEPGAGASLSSVGDYDGDGAADVAFGVRGQIRVMSGRTGSVLAGHGPECAWGIGTTSLAGPCNFMAFGGTRAPDFVVGIVNDNPGCGASSAYYFGTVVVVDPSTSKPSDGVRDVGFGGYGGVRIGDLDGDGLSDFAVSSAGQISVVSFATRSAILSVPGSGVSFAGDVDADGVADIAAGASGGVTVYSGVNGSAIWSVPGGLWTRRSGGSDLNGDGHADFLTCHVTQGVRVYSGSTGGVLYSFPAARIGTFVGDTNLDGVHDIALSDPDLAVGQLYTGVVWVHSGATGALLAMLDGTGFGSLGENFGYVIGSAGDADGDGAADVAVSSWSYNAMWTIGEVETFSGSSFASLGRTTNAIPYKGPAPGYAFVCEGDSDGDGKDDLSICNPGESGALGYTAVGAKGASPWDYFGYACDNLGDVDGDGQDDLAFESSAGHGVAPGLGSGVPRVVVASTACLYDRTYCSLSMNSTGNSATISAKGSGSHSRNALGLAVTGLPASKSGIFFMGDQSSSIPFGDGRVCVAGTVRRIPPVCVADASGSVLLSLDLTQSPLNLIAPGSTWNFQYWYRDPQGPLGSGFNFSDAVEIEFCP